MVLSGILSGTLSRSFTAVMWSNDSRPSGDVRQGYARRRVPWQRVLHTLLQTLRVCQERLHPRKKKQKRESSQEVKYVVGTYSKSAFLRSVHT